MPYVCVSHAREENRGGGRRLKGGVEVEQPIRESLSPPIRAVVSQMVWADPSNCAKHETKRELFSTLAFSLSLSVGESFFSGSSDVVCEVSGGVGVSVTHLRFWPDGYLVAAGCASINSLLHSRHL